MKLIQFSEIQLARQRTEVLHYRSSLHPTV